MTNRGRSLFIAALVALCAGMARPAARAQSTLSGTGAKDGAGQTATSDVCAISANERSPDPRCGETLDGRSPPPASTARQVGQAALVVPRLLTRAAFWPVVTTVDFVENHRLTHWARAILTTDDGLVGVRPEMQYSTSFLPTWGARFFYRRLPGPGSEIMTRFRTAGPSATLAHLGLRGPEWSGLSLLGTWNRRRDRLFAGIGPNTDAELAAAGMGRARYASDLVGGELRWSRSLPWHLVAQVHGGVERRNYSGVNVNGGPSVLDRYGLPPEMCASRGLAAPCVDEAEMPGFHRGTRVARFGGGLGLDLRSRLRDGGGMSLAIDGTYTQGVAGDPSRHFSTWIEAVGAMGGNDRLFILRTRATTVEGLGWAPIPFEELVAPSGLMDMRGLPDGRLRDRSALVGSAEYRWYISAYLDATLFVDVGTVAGPRFAGLDWSRWFPSFGVGFRFYQPFGPYWETKAVDGVQIAYAPEGGLRVLLALAAF